MFLLVPTAKLTAIQNSPPETGRAVPHAEKSMSVHDGSLRWHYPNQVVGRSVRFLSARFRELPSSRSYVVCNKIIARPAARRKPFLHGPASPAPRLPFVLSQEILRFAFEQFVGF